MGTSLHATLALLNIVELVLEKCILSAVNVGASLAQSAIQLAPKSSQQREILRVQQIGKRLQPKVCSDWLCEVPVMYFGFFSPSYCVKIHTHKTCFLKYYSAQFSTVRYIQ